MPFPLAIPLALSGISALAGLFGGRKQQQQSTSTSNSTSGGSSSYDNLSSPELSQGQLDLSRLFTDALINKFNAGPADLSGYEAGGLKNINRASDIKSQLLSNIMSQRGLSYSPAAASASAQQENDRVAQSTDFLNTIPLLKKQFEDKNIQDLISGFGALPTATRQTGTNIFSQNQSGTTTGTGQIPGNQLGGLFSGLGSGFALTLPQLLKAFGGGSSSGLNV